MSVVSGGTVSAPGYDPIIITKTISNDPVLAAAAAAYAATSGSTSSTTIVTQSTPGVTVVTNRDGSASYGVVDSGGSSFSPDVEVVVKGGAI